jgi:hypothetical protein
VTLKSTPSIDQIDPSCLVSSPITSSSSSVSFTAEPALSDPENPTSIACDSGLQAASKIEVKNDRANTMYGRFDFIVLSLLRIYKVLLKESFIALKSNANDNHETSGNWVWMKRGKIPILQQ